MSTFFYDAPQESGISFQDPGTPIAEAITDLHHSIFAIILVISIFVVYMLGALLKRWNRGWEKPSMRSMERNSQYLQTVNLVHHSTLETVWTIIPSIILMTIAVPSFALLYAMDEILQPELTLKVIGYQWYWHYELGETIAYREGYLGVDLKNYDCERAGVTALGQQWDSYMMPLDELISGDFKTAIRLLSADKAAILPSHTQIRVLVSSADVLHAWSVNSLGVKVDAVPGRLNQLSLYAKRITDFYGQCSELCGTNHAFMPIHVRIVPKWVFFDTDELIPWFIYDESMVHKSMTLYPTGIFPPGEELRVYETVTADEMEDWIEEMVLENHPE